MKKTFLALFLFGFLSISSAFAESGALVGNDADSHGCIASAGYTWNDSTKACERAWESTKYDTMEAFEKAEGLTCQSATDGCNTYFMTEDGKVGGGTLMYCENTPVEWSCMTPKDDGMMHITLGSGCWDATDENGEVILDETTKEPIQVCAATMLGGDSDSHGCIGSAGFTWSESKNMCMRPWEEKLLSDNDWSFYNSIQTQLTDTQREKVASITTKFSTLLEKIPEARQERLKKRFAEIIETKISKMLLKYPQDIALPAKADGLYKTLSFLKFQVILGR